MSQPEQQSSTPPAADTMPTENRVGKTQASRRSSLSRPRTAIGMVLLVVCTGVLGWQVHLRRDFWQSVWKSGSLFPSEASGTAFAQVGTRRRQSPAFDLSNVAVPANEIRSGGPPKDGIPALTNPKFVAAKDASYLRAEDRVIGVVAGDEARAYPLKILNYHEIVNDRLGGVPVAVTYCPLCDSAAVFDRRTPLGEREFGVSGLLYNSNVLMYDRGGKPESLWSQVMSEGISGPAVEKSLQPLPLELTTWEDWQRRYPGTKVLSVRTGHNRNYGRNPYAGYFRSPQLMFPVQPASNRLPSKERVLGVWTDTGARAYPESAFSRERTRVEDQLDGKRVVVQFDPESRSLRVVEADDGASWMYSFWFAWYAFHPETSVFEPDGAG